MHEHQLAPVRENGPATKPVWLDTDRAALVEVTSEEEGSPIEAALLAQDIGWRATVAGAQRIRLVFEKPQHIGIIKLIFEDADNVRTQEFVLRWSSDDGLSFHDIVRQQWNFSVPDAVREEENYSIELADVTTLELVIVPDKSGGPAELRLRDLASPDIRSRLRGRCRRKLCRSDVRILPVVRISRYEWEGCPDFNVQRPKERIRQSIFGCVAVVPSCTQSSGGKVGLCFVTEP